MKSNLLYAVIISSVLILSAFTLLATPGFPFSNEPESRNSLDIQGHVCRTIARFEGFDSQGNAIYGAPEQECDHNVLTEIGKNMTRDMLLGLTNLSMPLNVSLCNASAPCGAPNAGLTETFTGFVGVGCGMNAASDGTTSINPSTGGNYSIVYTYTSTCTHVATNVTRLTNRTGSTFAANSFSLANLTTNDQLTLNWTISIT